MCGIWWGNQCFRIGYRGRGLAWLKAPWLFSVRNNHRKNIKIGKWALVYLPPIRHE